MENLITSASAMEIETLQTETRLTLDELVQRGARRMLESALAAEVEAYIQQHQAERDEAGHALVVRNGKSRQRPIHSGAGVLKIEAPRVNDKRVGQKFSSMILPSYMRRTPRLEEAVPVLYLRGLSTGDFSEALAALLGESVTGFSATTVNYSTSERIGELIIQGDYAYVGRNDYGTGSLEIVSIADPANPTQIATIGTNGRVYKDGAIDGSFFYLSEGSSDSQFHVIDISDPENPQIVKSLPFSGQIGTVAIIGNYALPCPHWGGHSDD